MLLVKARVGKSEIHGLGLIAQEFIPKGTVTWRLVEGFDVLLTELEFQKLSSIAKDHVRLYGYFDRNLGKHVLPSDDDRFSNHADDANTTFLGDHAIAIRDINPGEEITDNYRDYGKPLDFLQQGLL